MAWGMRTPDGQGGEGGPGTRAMTAAEDLGIMTPQDPAFIHFRSEHAPPVTKPFPRGCPRPQRLREAGRPSALGRTPRGSARVAGGPGPAGRAERLL